MNTSNDFITIDGSEGEGGGQVLRTSLALSLITGRPFRIERIRARRERPGLGRQHLTAVQAAVRVGGASVVGAELGSMELEFRPSGVFSGDHFVSVGTAGSATLVVQTVLPPLLTASGPTRLVVEGGTHNSMAPPFEFLDRAFLPLLRRMGARVEATLDRPGFYPAGGGRITVTVSPVERLEPIELLERGALKALRATAHVSRLPSHVARRELERVRERLGWRERDLRVNEIRDAAGPGNALTLEIASEHVTEVFTGFGERRKPAERVADEAIRPARRYLESDVPVGDQLADQLLLPLALAGGGSFRSVEPTPHTRTNIETIQRFLDVDIAIEEERRDDGPSAWRVTVDTSRPRTEHEPTAMKSRDLKDLGIPNGEPVKLAFDAISSAARAGMDMDEIRRALKTAVDAPESLTDDEHFGALATALRDRPTDGPPPVRSDGGAPYRVWGRGLEAQSLRQIENACKLPVSVRGALMPDAHVGYGLPIGGVLATRNAVIPYAVGVDIACRVKMTVLDLPPETIDDDPQRLKDAITRETRFGIGAKFRDRRRHDVMDEDWSVSKVTHEVRDKAWAQLGTSGSGNHFVEFGVLTLERPELDLEPGRYLALLSHSGSRGAGATVAAHYSKLARKLHPELPRELEHLAWLDLDTEAGNEYWLAMELMGKYAAANHACIHRHITRNLGVEVLLDLENHHNFAWKEAHDGEEVVVHRKGATPAGAGVLGIIPGSMASATYIVRGKGSNASMDSCSHGAGRVMSRTQAKKTLKWRDAKRILEREGVTLMSAGLDEVPMVYKDIHEVMKAQDDLVETLATFAPRLVKMAPGGERAED